MSNNFMDNANATSVVTAIGNKIKARDKTFYGTEEQWAALSTAQKKEYDFKATPDGGVTLNGVQAKVEKNVLWIENRPLIAMENVEIYVNPQTGVDDYAGGYGYSAAKPFASIDYAQKYIPRLESEAVSGSEVKIIRLHLYGTYTSQTTKTYNFEYPSCRIYIHIEGDVVFNNCILQFSNCKYAILRLNGNLTFNVTNTSLSTIFRCIDVIISNVIIDSPSASAQNQYKVIINGNSTSLSFIRGIEIVGSKMYMATQNTSFEVNQCNVGVLVTNVGDAFFIDLSGANNNIVLQSSSGSILAFGSNSATGTTAQKTSGGGRIYTGQQ